MASGTLPQGLLLSQAGQITGTPTAIGTSSFTVKVVDTTSKSGTAVFSLAISAPLGPVFIGSTPHIAAQSDWVTTFTLVNKGTKTAQTQTKFFGDSSAPGGGGPLTLPLVFPQQAASLSAASLDQNISANASLIVQTAGSRDSPLQIGSAQFAATGSVDGFAIFRLIPGSQEAVVPMETRDASSYLLAFDNTGGTVLGVAVASVSSQPGNVSIVIRDENGAMISDSGASLALGANDHTSFVLPQKYPVTANKRGTIEFIRPAGGRISVLGIRTTPLNNTFTLTTIPALANVGPGGGSIAHIATGSGWRTTFVLVNTSGSAAEARLNFFATGSGAPLAIPLLFPQSGAGSNTVASSVSRIIGPGATLVVQSEASLSDPVTIGSAQLTATGPIGGFVIFHYTPNGQEAVVPLESRTAQGYLIAFDNTGGTVTGIAVNSVSAQSLDVPVIVRDDAGAQIDNGALALAANGHLSFTLGIDKFPAAAGKRGTIEFVTPAGGQIGVLGIRIPPTLTFTTLPALAK